MLRVVHVTHGYPPARGGSEVLMQHLSETLVQQHGYEVTVLTTNCYNTEGFWRFGRPKMLAGESVVNGVTVRRFDVPRSAGTLLRYPQGLLNALRLPGREQVRTWFQGPIMPGLKAAIHALRPDVIGLTAFPLLHMYQGLAIAQQMGVPCYMIGSIHPEDVWGFDRQMIYDAIRQCDAYAAHTQFEANYVIGRGADPQKVHVVGVGTDPMPYATVSRDEARARYGFGDSPVIGFVGQLAEHKGIAALLDAMPMVWAQFPTAQLLLAGAWTSYAEVIEQRLASEPLVLYRGNIHLKYNFDEAEKPYLFRAMDVFAYPSGFESFGVAYLEAWAAGVPVIGSTQGAIPWVVSGGRDGLLVPFGDAAALAGAIEVLLGNPRWAAELGAAGREKLLAHYTWQRIGEKTAAHYARLVAAFRERAR